MRYSLTKENKEERPSVLESQQREALCLGSPKSPLLNFATKHMRYNLTKEIKERGPLSWSPKRERPSVLGITLAYDMSQQNLKYKMTKQNKNEQNKTDKQNNPTNFSTPRSLTWYCPSQSNQIHDQSMINDKLTHGVYK